MSNIEKKYEEVSILFFAIILFIILLEPIQSITNGSLGDSVPYILSFLTLSEIIVIFVLAFMSKDYVMSLIDSYIDGMFLGKREGDTYYCQVCKSKVDKDDSFCSNCGMTM